MDQNDPGSVLSPATSLLCHESTDSLNDDADTEQVQDPAFINEFTPRHFPAHEQEQEEDDDYVTTLFAREDGYKFGTPAGLSESDKAWIQTARLHSIQWVMQSRVRLGFQYRTAYLSIMYFDRFLSLQWTILQGKDWRMRLLALTCLSLAAKMEEVKVLKLSDYSGGHAEFSFRTRWIKRMELKVLSALQWEMRFISPFCFVQFFLRNLFQESQLPSGKVVSSAALIIFQAATVTSTMDDRPSVLAMAATMLVMDETLTMAAVEAKISRSAVSSYGFVATAEQVHSCYEMMKKVLVDDRASLLAKSPSSSASSGVSGKRRRLATKKGSSPKCKKRDTASM